MYASRVYNHLPVSAQEDASRVIEYQKANAIESTTCGPPQMSYTAVRNRLTLCDKRNLVISAGAADT